MGTVDLAPAPVPVGPQPEVGLIHVAEQHELADLPQRGEPDDILDLFASDSARCGPGFVLPAQRQMLGVSTVPR